MSKSKLGSTTSDLGSNAPSGDQFNRFEVGTGGPADDFVIGISTPFGDDGSTETSMAVEGVSFNGASDAASGVGAWESIYDLTPNRDEDEVNAAKGGSSPNAANPAGNNIGVLLPLGTNPDGSHYFTGNRNVDAVLIGSKWGTTNLTYSFPTSGTQYSTVGFDTNGVNSYQITLGSQQQAAARAAFAQLSAYSGLTFTEITETDTVHANIRISQTADADVPSAYGNFPSDTKSQAGDIWFGSNNQPYYDLAYKGTWGFATMMHEIGHTMGLKHGHQDYTNSDLSGFFGTFPRVGTRALTPDRDGQAWSLMTYSPAPGVGQPFAGDKISQPQSYMQYDIAALQYMYGANFNTNNTDTVYTFSQTTGEMFINGVGQGAPSGNRIFLTIWDGGGNDTIDVSNYANGVTVDLRPGEFSTFDPNQVVNNLAYRNTGVSFAPGNVAMSLLYNNDARSLIENAKGGSGNDVFVGNTANNLLDGGTGGSDTVIFTNPTGVTVTLNDTNTDVIVNHDGETDTLRSIENIGGTSGNDTITGNSLDNVLTGGSGGADVLNGLGGNDVLIGGGFTVSTVFNPGTPASQPDITKLQATNNGSIANAVNTAGFYDIDANPNITSATTIPHATINATAFGGVVEYYRIDVTAAGAQAIFDIDGTGSLSDSIIELVDASGVLLANNDTGPGDPGTTTGDDAYITYTFAAAGTYYVRVGRFTSGSVAQPMLAGQTYQLHISLQGAVGTTTFVANNTASLNANGGEGNDVVVGTLADDTLIGGNGNDTVSYVNAFSGGGLSTTGVTVDLNQQQGAAQNTVKAGNDTLFGFENVIGSQYDDTITGDNNDNVIEGGLGNDTLVGGNGNDTASYAGAAAGVTVSLALQGAGQATVNAGTDNLSGFENLLGSAFADNLTGNASANTLTGGAGDDTLNPGANAGGTVDLLDGGIGSDTASFAGVASGVTVTLNGAADVTASIGGNAIATLRSIENLAGSANGDTLTGDGNANVIEGGLGDDTLDGGGGIDTLRFTGSTAVTVNLATLVAQNTGWGNDTITGFENVRTGSGADNVTGDGNDNIFFDGGGNDTYNGAGGVDTVDYSGATSTVSVNLNTVVAQNTGTSGGSDTITNVENVIGSATFANVLQGNTVANRLTGGSAADTIVGFSGNDVLIGGAGDDLLLGGNNSGTDDLSSDIVDGGIGNDFVSGGQGDDIVRGGDGDDTLVGGAGNSLGQFFTGVDGGNDTYDGGDGTDAAIMVYDTRLGVGASTVGIAFDISNLAGDSAITFNGVNVGSLTSIERVTFRGTTVNDNVKGGGYLDSLTGGAGDDVLDGWLGNDTLEGGAGNDTLIGGEDLDTATYANATAGVVVDLRIVGAQDTVGAGIDTLSGIEYLIGSTFGDTLKGTDDFNLITDSGVGVGATALSQTDSLFGFGGNDSILVTRAAAAVATNINMDGGDGDDFIELRGGTLSSALATNAAGLVASPTGASQTYMALGTTSSDRNVDVVTVDGGAGNDRIVLSGVASATVNAGSGNDILSISMRGAAGVNAYNITLGSGADIIQLGGTSAEVAATARNNVVTDFDRGNSGDKFEMTTYLNNGLTGYVANSNAFADGHLRLLQSGTDLLLQVDRDGAGATNSFVTIFTLTGGYTGGFTAFNFDGFIGNLTLTGFGTDETITGATGDDVLSGAGGTDVLNGLGGTDTLNGGTGNDTLDGGTGFDTAVYAGNRADYTITYLFDSNGRINGFASIVDNNAGNGDEGTDTLISIEALSFADGVLNATLPVQLFNGSTLIGTFSTIQAAVNAASAGNVIDVPAGTFNENVLINKDVTIIGANDGLPGTDGTRGAETIINGQISVTVAGVTIDGVEIIGAAPGSLGTTAVEVSGDNFSLVNSILDGSGDAAIVTGTVTGLDIGSNLIEGYTIGVYVSGFTTAGSIHDNLIQGDGSGSGSGVQEGVFLETAFVILNGNTFDGVDGNAILVNPHGPDAIDLRDIVLNTIITDSGVDRPVQVLASAQSTHITGTDFNEAMYDFNAGGPGEIIDNLYFDGQGGDDHLFGNSLADTLLGGAGQDELYGGGGDDALTGGADDDLLDGEAGIDTALFANTSVTYTSTAIGWLIASSEGNDFLQRTEIVVGGTGQRNLLVGGTAFAGIQAAFDAASAGDFVRLANGSYSGTSSYSDANLTVIAQPGAVLNATFTTAGTDGITVVAAGGADTITTGAGNDVLFGGAGVDHLNGGGGNDQLTGGTGADVMAGGTGDDFYFIDNGGDQVIDAVGQGSDRVFASVSYTLTAGAEVEVLSTDFHAGTNAINLTGNELANYLLGNDGDNFLDGAAGADLLIGRSGNDFYFIDNAGDQVVETTGQGSDRVFAGASYTLAAGVDVEVMSTDFNAGTNAINLTGNELSQVIFGNNGANIIDGGAGADTLVGNAGNDTFAFTSALGGGNVDNIADFQGGGDKIALDDAIFTQIGGLGALNPNAFFAGTAAHDADDRIIYDQATGNLFYDADGNGAGAAVLFANLGGAPTITANDFVVI